MLTSQTDMYGQIHVIIRTFVRDKVGPEVWRKIMSGLDEEENFKMLTPYDDQITWKLIDSVVKFLDLTWDIFLEVLGSYFIQYWLTYGYDRMLRVLGQHFDEFIDNLDFFHSYLTSATFEQSRMPLFCIEREQPKSKDVTSDFFTLHYYSHRRNLSSFLKGALQGVAKFLFTTKITVEISGDEAKENLGLPAHYILHVTVHDKNATIKLPKDIETDNLPLIDNPTAGEGDFVDGKIVHELFPFHFVLDAGLLIVQLGPGIASFCRQFNDTLPRHAKELFSIVQPCGMEITKDNFLTHTHTVYVIAVRGDRGAIVQLRGSIIDLRSRCGKHGAQLMFVGTLQMRDVDEMLNAGAFLTDLARHDAKKEAILMNQQRKLEVGISEDLKNAMAELRSLHGELDIEKKKTELLLSEMLPASVAKQLKEQGSVEAEKFPDVTIIFSDIVSFTTIAAACNPIDIVNMLNELYNLFDLATGRNNVYKVETIGDAYMVSSGLPVRDELHAEKAATQAMDMVESAGEVKNPVTGQPIQIRVGMHSGPVVAGVVGQKMPRYCLFGDTVNTASRMESNSVASRIHLSDSTHALLQKKGYEFEDRGEISIKGKGIMRTYFLIGSPNRLLSTEQANTANGSKKEIPGSAKSAADTHNGSKKSCICMIS